MGTRMASITAGSAKELLRLGGKSVLERVIEEAREALVDDVIVVSSRDKMDLTSAALELGARVALQEEPLGLAYAVAAAEVEDEALVLNGDCVFGGGSPAYRIAELVRRAIPGCIAVEGVDDQGTRLYGIVEVDENTGGIQRILEKPGPKGTRSRWAVAGRYAFGAAFMAFLARYCREAVLGPGQELSLTPIFNAAIEEGFDLKAAPLQRGQERLDCGDPEAYALARRFSW
jgi:dTDP-glucose pyrophosphorylase